jgi:farnesyl-diphosphate farnesyltransferase
MTRPKLDRKILKSVSRSFYLSIRLLPKAVRVPVGIAYLLARASDTIADTESAPVETRLRRLAEFEGLVRGTPSAHAIASIQRDIQPSHSGERALIAALPKILDALSGLETWEWNETSALMGNIIRGQSNDLETFATPGQIIALPNAAALEDYIYLVAGCVGEWWTRICFHHLPKYSGMQEQDLTHIADSFGKALQLVNILRDMQADLAAGRCYLPADELAEHGVSAADLRENPERAQPVADHWLARARRLLEQARFYIGAVRIRRIRLACYLPWRLAGKTLDLLERQSPLSTRVKLKVPRSAVRAALWEGLQVAFTNRVPS